MILSAAPLFIFVAFVSLVVPFVRSARRRDLLGIPGPFWAKFTNLWRFHDVLGGAHHETIMRLHKENGPLVRLGPNSVSIADPKMIEKIYGLRANFPKSEFYSVFEQLVNGQPVSTLFTVVPERAHAALKRPVSAAYSMSTLTQYESIVDRTIQKFLGRLEEEFVKGESVGKVCPISKWVQWYAFDVIADITWSSQLGFLDSAKDVDNMIKQLDDVLEWVAPVGQLPFIDRLYKHFASMTRQPDSPILKFAVGRVLQRLNNNDPTEQRAPDFLDKFLKAKSNESGQFQVPEILQYLMSNIAAGSDTTAISLRSILYYLLKHPQAHHKLVEELKSTKFESFPVSWKESQSLPYMDACVKEAMRLHPAVGMNMERVVPASGLELPDGAGRIQPGTVVGVNAWVIHRDPSVFGDHPDDFIPERWLQSKNEDADHFTARIGAMKRADLTFGYGSRTCIGKNIALLEIYKVLPSLLLSFDISLADQAQKWHLKNSWFVRQSGIDVVLKKR
ncbi:cytochrome P450 [Neofusicoccum parvum]|nr:cytochrome P450 [Neofusicoccum parvum]